MPRIKIIGDSASDFPRELAEELDVQILPLQVIFGNKVYNDYIDINPKMFFELLKTTAELPHTSLIPPDTVYDTFQSTLDSYDGLMFVTLSSNGSGTYNSAMMIKNQLESDLGRKLPIEIFDSQKFCAGESLIIENVARAAKEGADMDELLDIAKHYREYQGCIVTVDSLKHLARGGRISNASAFVGDVLGLKPLLTIKDGTMLNIGKERGKKKIIAAEAKHVLDDMIDKRDTQLWFMQEGNLEDCDALRSAIAPHITVKYERTIEVGAVIGTHIGPGVHALIYSTKNY